MLAVFLKRKQTQSHTHTGVHFRGSREPPSPGEWRQLCCQARLSQQKGRNHSPASQTDLTELWDTPSSLSIFSVLALNQLCYTGKHYQERKRQILNVYQSCQREVICPGDPVLPRMSLGLGPDEKAPLEYFTVSRAGETIHIQRTPKRMWSWTTGYGFVCGGETPGLRVPAALCMQWGSCCPHPQRPYLPPAVLIRARLWVNKSFTGWV